MWESWMWAKQAPAPFVHVLLLIRWSSERHFAWSVWSNQAGRCWPGFSYRPGNQVKSIVHLRCQGQRLWAERLPYLSFQRVGIRMKPILEAGPHNATKCWGQLCHTMSPQEQRHIRLSKCLLLNAWRVWKPCQIWLLLLSGRERKAGVPQRESGNTKLTERQEIKLHLGMGSEFQKIMLKG